MKASSHIVEISAPPTPDGRRSTHNTHAAVPVIAAVQYYCFECQTLGVLDLPFINPGMRISQAQHQHLQLHDGCSGKRIVLDPPVLGGAA